MLQKFLILGGEGFVGTHLYNELNARNYSVKRTVRSNSLSDLSGDINESLLDKCEKPDVIFHVAGGASALLRPGALRRRRAGWGQGGKCSGPICSRATRYLSAN